MQSTPPSTPSGLARWADWFSPGRFALLLGMLVFAAFPEVILGSQTFVIRDYGLFSYPFAFLQRESFWHGELPLWNPYNNCGIPFLAQWNTMLLYPLDLIYLLLPFTWGFAFFCLLHQWFAGVGMYWLARRWTNNNAAAAFAGVVFAFNGLTVNMLMWPNHIASLAWAPWVILLAQRAWLEGGRRIPLAALVGALQMLSGGPETIFFTWVLVGLLWLAHLAGTVRSGLNTVLAAVWRLPVVLLLVVGLAAVQLFPFLDFVAHSQREAGYADTRWSMPATGWMNFLVPMVYTCKWNLGIFFQYDQGWTSSYYAGVGTLLLVLVAVAMQFRRKDEVDGLRRTIWFMAIAAVLAVFVSQGDHNVIGQGLRRLIPQLSLMTFPIKYVVLVTLIAPLLAAIALARLPATASGKGVSNPARLIAIITSLLLAGIAVTLFWAWHWPLPADNFSATLINGLTRAGFLVAEAGLLLLLVLGGGISTKRWTPLLLVLVVWLDLVTHMPTQNPTAQPWVYEPGLARTKLALSPQPALGGSRVMVSPLAEQGFLGNTLNPQDNFLVKRLGYFADANLLDAVPKVNGFFSLFTREQGMLNSFLYHPSNTISSGLLDFMGVSQITAPGEFTRWQTRDSFLPLVTIGQRPVFLDDLHTLSAMLAADFNPARVVFLPEGSRAQVNIPHETRAQVLESHFKNGRVEVEVEAEELSLVVLSQTYYHVWRARVDGREVPLLRANYAFQAVQVPAGKHQVSVVYEDRAFVVGAWITGFSLLACGLGWMLSRRAAS